ncbi:class I SAM-dependent methyltransferase [Aurantiacibacter gangjinensis]|uniref:class I SAM-dependent methyltransferase n=1 Tax=Aurantiacibacter gangjinensis TaxID=502682 RepID=UPI00069A6C5A|nr:class I SAM-dependent methyltransferase [Aurantiacibacter gangjinensis]APE28514.1 hypothetical protein BMF35_a1685 [Aurantiacibacter gangjinensis]
MTIDTDNAWNRFWERDSKRARGQSGGSGCMPSAWQGIADMQKRVWQSFARKLDKGARVLDLATGDGVVLSMLAEGRADLDLTGVDRATALPPAPKGTTLRGGIGMEDLPFEDDSFDAVTSQFGFEYGDIERVAAELARVLRPGGRLGLLTHRLNGPIVAHNRQRKIQILWAIEEQDLIAKARASLAARDAGVGEIPPAIAEAPQAGKAAHGDGSAAWEIAEATRQTLHMGRRDERKKVEAILDEIEAQAKNELGRIASLEDAAAVASDADRVVDVLAEAGLQFSSEAMLTDGRSPDPFADFRTYTLI